MFCKSTVNDKDLTMTINTPNKSKIPKIFEGDFLFYMNFDSYFSFEVIFPECFLKIHVTKIVLANFLLVFSGLGGSEIWDSFENNSKK